MKLKHASLFSGIGGFDLAAEWMGWTNVFQVEIDPFCQAVLRKNFKDVPIHGDIKTFDGKPFRGTVDILTGGFPCQKFSLSGKGAADLTEWKEMYRVIRDVQPSWVVAENVYGLLIRKSGLAFETVCTDLEDAGYEVQSFLIPASAVGAYHKRERMWICAHSEVFGREGVLCNQHEASAVAPEASSEARTSLDPQCNPFLHFTESMGEPPIFGVADGVPKRLDLVNRLGACGNAIVPQVAFEIFKAIELAWKEMPSLNNKPNSPSDASSISSSDEAPPIDLYL